MKETDTERIIKQILSRRDPFGYFIVVAVNSVESRKIIDKYTRAGSIIVEYVGDVIIIRGKSRRMLEDLARDLIVRNLLAEL